MRIKCNELLGLAGTVPVPRRRVRGVMLWDALLGLMLVAIMLTGVATVTVQHRRLDRRLHQQRARLYQAEAVLTRLQRGEPMRAGEHDEVVELRLLPEVDAPPGRQWVEVIVGERHRRASLSGVVPSNVLPDAMEGSEP